MSKKGNNQIRKYEYTAFDFHISLIFVSSLSSRWHVNLGRANTWTHNYNDIRQKANLSQTSKWPEVNTSDAKCDLYVAASNPTNLISLCKT